MCKTGARKSGDRAALEMISEASDSLKATSPLPKCSMLVPIAHSPPSTFASLSSPTHTTFANHSSAIQNHDVDEIEAFLVGAGLGEYVPKFKKEGFKQVSQLFDVSDHDFLYMGVRVAHKIQFRHALQQIQREKHQAQSKTTECSTTTDLSSDTNHLDSFSSSSRDISYLAHTQNKDVFEPTTLPPMFCPSDVPNALTPPSSLTSASEYLLKLNASVAHSSSSSTSHSTSSTPFILHRPQSDYLLATVSPSTAATVKAMLPHPSPFSADPIYTTLVESPTSSPVASRSPSPLTPPLTLLPPPRLQTHPPAHYFPVKPVPSPSGRDGFHAPHLPLRWSYPCYAMNPPPRPRTLKSILTSSGPSPPTYHCPLLPSHRTSAPAFHPYPACPSTSFYKTPPTSLHFASADRQGVECPTPPQESSGLCSEHGHCPSSLAPPTTAIVTATSASAKPSSSTAPPSPATALLHDIPSMFYSDFGATCLSPSDRSYLKPSYPSTASLFPHASSSCPNPRFQARPNTSIPKIFSPQNAPLSIPSVSSPFLASSPPVSPTSSVSSFPQPSLSASYSTSAPSVPSAPLSAPIRSAEKRPATPPPLAPQESQPTPAAGRTTPHATSHTDRRSLSPSLDTGDNLYSSKRPYRRHPKPDPSEPSKPFSAYMMFSNEVRQELKDQCLSFSKLAKLVGERWKHMDPQEKQAREDVAANLKAEYHEKLLEYRQTPQFKQYLRYLNEFEASAALSGRPFIRVRKRMGST